MARNIPGGIHVKQMQNINVHVFGHTYVDRGILMTFGSGTHGSLGHGNHNDVVQAKIVEALIGFEVEQVTMNKLYMNNYSKEPKGVTTFN